jgi:hypothetical protein
MVRKQYQTGINMKRTIPKLLALVLITVTILMMPGQSHAAETPMLPRGGLLGPRYP